VYGNNDEKRDTLGLRLHADFDLGSMRFHLVHQLLHARAEPGTQVVVFGHSHRPLVENRAGVLYVNPGAAGRAGFHRVQTVALLRIACRRITDVRIVELGPRELLGPNRKGRASARPH
jgi:predicted phosphodiesterase